MRVPADEAAQVAGPHVLLAFRGRGLCLEDLPVRLGSLDALVVAAHAVRPVVVGALLSPIHGVNAVDSSWDNPPILRQYWPAARRLKDGQTAAVGYDRGTAAGNILDIKTVFISAASSPVLAPPPMHPVLHSSCSTPVPYVPGLTALEIDTSVRAGFPSPAEDFQAARIDVLKQIILHPQATYTVSPANPMGGALWS